MRLIDATTGEVIYSTKGRGKASQTAATGKSLGAPEVLVGTVVVDRVLEQFSTAKVPEGATIARGHVVRLKPTKGSRSRDRDGPHRAVRRVGLPVRRVRG